MTSRALECRVNSQLLLWLWKWMERVGRWESGESAKAGCLTVVSIAAAAAAATVY